jgi:hypothetical protein
MSPKLRAFVDYMVEHLFPKLPLEPSIVNGARVQLPAPSIRACAEGVFQPQDLRILTGAFDEAWRRLEKSGVRFDSNYQRREARNTLGKYIIDAAKDGERDKRRLRDCALLLYGQSSLLSE